MKVSTEINIGKKFLSKNISSLIEKYWLLSFKSDFITFNLDNTEWISNSEILFLIGWMNKLSKLGKIVSIQLPSIKGLPINSNEYKRRERFQLKFLNDWDLSKNLDKSIKLLSGGFDTSNNRRFSINEIFELPLIDYDYKTFDKFYFQLYNNENIGIYKNHKKLLNETDLTHLESDFLNYSIVKELYSNTILHSGLETSDYCYYSISINQKIAKEKANITNLKNRWQELSNLERIFFEDEGTYRNINFVELNFQDFGRGISNTLSQKYSDDIKNLKRYFEESLDKHLSANLDSKILHYSLLLFSSSFEIDKKYAVHDFIPRGLFIVKELIEKYQGYLEIFSNNGAISVGYKNGVENIEFAKKDNIKKVFNGTRIRIVFPSKNEIQKTNYKKRNSSVKTVKQNNNPKFIHLLSTFLKVKNSSGFSIDQLNKEHILITSLFFEKILKKINKLSTNRLVIIDFAGFNKEHNDLYSKFIYFISHTPSNANYRIIITNIVVRGLNDIYISNVSESKSKGFYPYPVPIIYPDLTIEWLGIDDNLLINKLNETWKGDNSNYVSSLDDYYKYYSSILSFVKDQSGYRITVNLPSFEEILNQINEWISDFIKKEIKTNKLVFDELKDDKHDYNKVLKRKDNAVFHNSYGNYQNVYLTFNDKLYIKNYRAMLATYFFFKDYFFQSDLHSTYVLENTDKLFSVTLSSQFLAFEVQKLFKEFFDKDVEIIALSNYYTFYNERRFKDIKSGDNILVINDIVSTGRLTENIFNSLEKIGAKPICCLAIVDLRESKRNEFDYPIISVSKYSIETFSEKPADKNIEWINPVLNTPVSMKKEKHQLTSLLSKNEFLDIIDEDDILIGNMKSNSYGLVYYLNTYSLLAKDMHLGFPL